MGDTILRGSVSRRRWLGSAGAAAMGTVLAGETSSRAARTGRPAPRIAGRTCASRRLQAFASARRRTSRSRPIAKSPAGARSRAWTRTWPSRWPSRCSNCSTARTRRAIEHLWQKLYRAHRDMRGGPFMTHVISAIDMALWDITGKLWGVPVYRLLGGPTRDKIRLYPSAKAHKVGTGGPHPEVRQSARHRDRLVQQVKQQRERVGPDGAVMFDAHCAMPPAMLIQFANAIEPYDLLFIEEPAVPGNIEVFKRTQAADPHPAGDRRTRPHDLGVPAVPAGALHRHPAARLRPHRRHQPDEEDRRRWPRRSSCRWPRTARCRNWA